MNKKIVGIFVIMLLIPSAIQGLEEIDDINQDSTINGLIVQLPLPEHIYIPEVIRAIDPKKDVDGFHAYNIGKMFLSPEFEDLPPATPLGIVKLLDHYNIPIQGKEVVVVGHSNIVGKPISIMMLNRNATVTTCHIYTKDLPNHTKRADILIVAAGVPEYIKGDMIKPGAVVIDVGVNEVGRTEDGKRILKGDVAFDEASEVASAITPVPGGVGPMTITMLMKNTVHACKVHHKLV